MKKPLPAEFAAIRCNPSITADVVCRCNEFNINFWCQEVWHAFDQDECMFHVKAEGLSRNDLLVLRKEIDRCLG